jgi:CelD/BcsL family acetyltransferase involved in cellulose biosynthesis
MSIVGELVDGAEALAPHLEAWDALAMAARQPYCAPAWMLAWWRHAAPPGARLRVVLACEGEELVGVAPFCVVHDRLRLSRYRLLASGTCSPVGPLAAPGLEQEVGEIVARTLAAARPAPSMITLEGVAAGSPWPGLLARGWPGRPPRVVRHGSEPVPTVSLDGMESLDDWLAAKSAHFRREMRRNRRRLLAAGATFRLAQTPQEADRALEAFARLHHANWSARGGSGALGEGVERMLRDVAAGGLLDAGRFRVWAIEVDGTIIAGRVALAAGGELALWLSGFDEAWASHSPSMQSILTAVEDAVARGERRIMLGPGAQEWKYRLADAADAVESVTLVPAGAKSPAARGLLRGESFRAALAERLPPAAKARIKAVVRRRPSRAAARRSP